MGFLQFPSGTYSLDWEGKLPVAPSHCLHHWTWISRDTFLCSASVGSQSQLCVFDMDSTASGEQGRLAHRYLIFLEIPITL